MKYFAYGSNMSLPRFMARVPGAAWLGPGTLTQHHLRFHKVGNDGSGKCDAFHTGHAIDRVYGALFEIADWAKDTLDRIEGLGQGYGDKVVPVTDAWGQPVEAVTYYATVTRASVLPYSWYLNHVIYGARQTGVPPRYLMYIEATRSIEDPDRERDARERAIYR